MLLGAYQIRGAYAAQGRGFQQWDEAFKENWSDANLKNFCGQLPKGTLYDDPCEPGFREFWDNYAYETSAPARTAWQRFQDWSADLAGDIQSLYGG